MGAGKRSSGKTRDEIAQAYRSEPWWYDVRGFFILTFAYNSTLPEQIRHFANNFGARHLEVACGTGTLLELVLRWRRWKGLPAGQIVGVDYAESMLAGAIHRFRKSKDMEFIHADAADLPFPEASFDTANIANAVHCFPEVERALQGIFRVMKPGATLAVNVLLYPLGEGFFARLAHRINDWGMRKGILYRPYRAEEVTGLMRQSGFEIVSSHTSGNCLNLVARRPVAA